VIYKVELIILNKDGIRDPEGETIQKYVVEKISKNVNSTRAGKYILFNVESSSPEEAEKTVKRIAEEGRLYNPIVHKIIVRVNRDEDGDY
jgi:phosphoribosylformylglycinamidine synthase, purS protein